MSDYGVYQDFNRHSAIRVKVGDSWTYFIPMLAGELRVDRLSHHEFARQFKQLPDYPLQRAAEKFLNRTLQTVAPRAREHLERILRGQPSSSPTTEEGELTMSDKIAGKKAAPAKKAAEKPAAPAKKGAKAAAPAAPTPAKKGAKASAAPAEKTRGRPRDDSSVYTVGNTESVKRGFLAEYVAAAQKLGNFTRDALVKKFEDTERALRYFYYCTGKGIFAATQV